MQSVACALKDASAAQTACIGSPSTLSSSKAHVAALSLVQVAHQECGMRLWHSISRHASAAQTACIRSKYTLSSRLTSLCTHLYRWSIRNLHSVTTRFGSTEAAASCAARLPHPLNPKLPAPPSAPKPPPAAPPLDPKPCPAPPITIAPTPTPPSPVPLLPPKPPPPGPGLSDPRPKPPTPAPIVPSSRPSAAASRFCRRARRRFRAWQGRPPAALSSILKRKSSSQERQNSAEGSGLCCRMAALKAGVK
jgi:hypothetical protein